MMPLFTNPREPANAVKHKKRAWFCSVEIGDIALILTFKNGRN